MIYLDNNATTQVDPRALDAMLPYLREQYANPSSSYASARSVRQAVDTARGQVAALIDAEPDEIVFVSGGTESDNAAISSALTLDSRRTHFVTAKTEHSAVLEFARRWSFTGRPVTEIDVDADGIVNLQELRGATKPGQTALVSIMWANNETGVIAPIAEAAALAHERGALFHTDAVQAAGKLPVSVKEVPVDYLSLSGHKFHAPKGIGALFISRRVRYKPWMLGGPQESGRRAGTEPVPNIVALGKAAELMREELANGGSEQVRAMRDEFEKRVFSALPDTVRIGHAERRLATTSCLSFPEVDSAGLLILLDEKGVAAAAGSACHTGALNSSHVLDAMGCDARRAQCAMRFSWSRMNTMDETVRAADIVIACVNKMRSLRGGDSPVLVSS